MDYLKIFHFLCISFSLFYGCDALNCYKQLCRECNEKELNGKMTEVTCSVKNIVAVDWLGTSATTLPDPPNVNPEFACIKMTASNPDILGDSTDIVKGCVIYMGAEYQCSLFGGLEVARGKKNAKCDYCLGDNCNGSSLKVINVSYIMICLLIVYLQ